MSEINNLTPNTDHRESFVFYHSFKEAIDETPEEVQPIIYKSIVNYALYREEPNLEGVAKIVWILVKPQLDANWRKYEKGCRGGASGKLGGRPRKNPNGVISKTPNVNDNDNVKDNGNGNGNEWETTTTTPLLSDIISFVSEQRLDVDPNYFYDYYSSTCWMMGKRPMKDWRAALRNWDRIADKQNTPAPNPTHAKMTVYNDL